MDSSDKHREAGYIAGFSGLCIASPSLIMLANESSLPLKVMFGTWLIFGLIELGAALFYTKNEFYPIIWIISALTAFSEAIVVFGLLEPPTYSMEFKITVTVVLAIASWLLLAIAIGLLRLRETSNTMISGKD